MSSVKRVFFALIGGEEIPGARERVLQYIPHLNSLGIETRTFIVGQIPYGIIKRNYWFVKKFLGNVEWSDVFINYRVPFPKWQTYLIRKAAKRMLMDFDDAIFTYPPYQIEPREKLTRKIAMNKYFISNCNACIVGNSYLEDWAKQYTQVFVVPTCVDTDKYTPKPGKNSTTTTIGWIGTQANLEYLKICASSLSKIKTEFADRVKIVINSGDFPKSFNFLDFDHERRIWSLKKDVTDYQEVDIGLMPLDNSEWSQGKCSFKAILHMSCGSPVVLSPVGLNKDVVTNGHDGFWASNEQEWYDSIEKLVVDAELRKTMGDRAREKIVTGYSHKIGLEKLQSILNQDL